MCLAALFLRASQVLHNKMFKCIIRAPIYFFDTNPIGMRSFVIIITTLYVGRVLNRLSKDVGFMDDMLVFYFLRYARV